MTFEIAKNCLENRRRDCYIDDRGTSWRVNTKAIIEGKYILTIDGLEENGIFSKFSVDNLIWGIAIYAAREMNHCNRFSIVGP